MAAEGGGGRRNVRALLRCAQGECGMHPWQLWAVHRVVCPFVCLSVSLSVCISVSVCLSVGQATVVILAHNASIYPATYLPVVP